MNTTELVQMLFGRETCDICVLDVGALGGMAGHEAPPYDGLVKAGLAHVLGFEPDAEGCEALNKKYANRHCFLPHFVGEGGPATYHETNWAPTGSLYKPNQPLLEKFQNMHELTTLIAEHPIETKRIDDLAEVGDVDFVKVDVQGAELAVFKGGERVMRNALLVHTEVEFVALYENQPLFADVDTLLRSYGYQFHTFVGFAGRCFKPVKAQQNINSYVRQLLWADAIYVRDWMHFSHLPLGKLNKLAVLLHEMVRSFDLCHLVLQAIDAREGGDRAPRYLKATGLQVHPPA